MKQFSFNTPQPVL